MIHDFSDPVIQNSFSSGWDEALLRAARLWGPYMCQNQMSQCWSALRGFSHGEVKPSALRLCKAAVGYD